MLCAEASKGDGDRDNERGRERLGGTGHRQHGEHHTDGLCGSLARTSGPLLCSLPVDSPYA